MRIELTVNGERHEADVWAGESLLFALRERLGLPGSKNACEQGECGSCSVLLDGQLVCSCLVLAAQADGHDVVTVEGLAGGDGELHPVQDAFVRAGRGPVRLLHARARRRGGRPAPAQPEALRRRDPRGAVRQPLPLHGVPEDPRGRAARGRHMSTAARPQLELGRVGESVARVDGIPKTTGEFAYSSDLVDAGHALGPHGAEPARARADHANRHLRRPDACPASTPS